MKTLYFGLFSLEMARFLWIYHFQFESFNWESISLFACWKSLLLLTFQCNSLNLYLVHYFTIRIILIIKLITSHQSHFWQTFYGVCTPSYGLSLGDCCALISVCHLRLISSLLNNSCNFQAHISHKKMFHFEAPPIFRNSIHFTSLFPHSFF